MGKRRMTHTAEWLLGGPMLGKMQYRPKLVLMAGYAGGLRDDLSVGDVVLATEVMDQSGKVLPATWPGQPLQGEWQPPLHRGRILTVDRIVATPEEKQRLGKEHNALAVDMESAVLGQMCARHEVSFGCVRVLSDAVDTRLSPHLARLLTGEQVAVSRILLAMLRRPWLAAEYWRLAQQTRRASERLGLALGELLTLTLPWMGD
jgi:adenosylhomocysteine nucleosidase